MFDWDEEKLLQVITVNNRQMTDHNAVNTIHLDRIQEASVNQKAVVTHTPLMENLNLSRRFGARIWLKREGLHGDPHAVQRGCHRGRARRGSFGGGA